MKIISMAVASAAMAFAAIPFASPAAAQGAEAKFPVPRAGCPKNYQKSRRGSDTIFYCYPNKSSNDEKSSSSSSSSSSSGAVYQPLARGSFKKRNAADRCPVGYWTTQEDINTCASPSSAKIPATRLKGSSACSADEVDEWGLYCTSKSTSMTRSEAEDIAAGDVNNYYVLSGGGNQTQGYDYANTPGIIGIFGGGGGSAGTSSSASPDSAGNSQTAQASGCANGSATGAAIGGAMAGEGGAALGSMLGGLGKKKKKQGC
ncbi:hypothetical protein [Blastomonas sp. SL216]|uniref:hypothetical protein n=1 Tax=Blastomonas sp. SL216 TaxID=2995169 RepID=UPI0023773EF8|nr:hypothetical protein OU999_11380 [Blastomonas sp. SL216]